MQLPPGYYTGTEGISLQPGSNVNLQCDPDAPLGCLFVTDQLSIKGKLTGTNITIYVTDVLETGLDNDLAIDIGAKSTVELSAPTAPTAPFQNLLLFNSRYGSRDCNVRGGADSVTVGAIYCPTGFLDYGGNSTSNVTVNLDYSVIIGYQIQFHGNPQVNATFTGSLTSSQFSEVRLVE